MLILPRKSMPFALVLRTNQSDNYGALIGYHLSCNSVPTYCNPTRFVSSDLNYGEPMERPRPVHLWPLPQQILTQSYHTRSSLCKLCTQAWKPEQSCVGLASNLLEERKNGSVWLTCARFTEGPAYSAAGKCYSTLSERDRGRSFTDGSASRLR